MQFAPKDQNFSWTFSLFDRLYLVVVEDLVGLEKSILKIHEHLGILTNPLLERWCHMSDRSASFFAAHRRKPEQKKKRIEKRKYLFDADR
jgi:hypothetical protein